MAASRSPAGITSHFGKELSLLSMNLCNLLRSISSLVAESGTPLWVQWLAILQQASLIYRRRGVIMYTCLSPQTARIRLRLATAAAIVISCATMSSPTT